ncbi:hypothetical protein G9A89_003396 [Geosiphon pyriformis]|nr:hypothetical protein G9A89_003396 [Geosiphon pyriformis]
MKFKDFDIDGKFVQYDVGKEEVEEIKKWALQQIIEFLEKKSEELFLIKEDLDIIKTNRISGQDFLLLTEEKLLQDGIKRRPAMRIAFLVEKLKGKEQVKKQRFNRSYAVLKNAFKNTLIKPRENYINTLQQFYALYTSLIQASNIGKSKLLRELAFEKDIFVVYICLHNSELRDYPKHSIIADVLTEKAFQKLIILLFCRLCLAYVQNSLINNFIKMQKIYVVITNEIATDLKQASIYCYRRVKKLLQRSHNYFKKPKTLQAIPHESNACFMALFTDTLLKISDFSLAKCHDPSARVDYGERLYKPFYLLDIFDCHMQ